MVLTLHLVCASICCSTPVFRRSQEVYVSEVRSQASAAVSNLEFGWRSHCCLDTYGIRRNCFRNSFESLALIFPERSIRPFPTGDLAPSGKDRFVRSHCATRDAPRFTGHITQARYNRLVVPEIYFVEWPPPSR